MGRIQILDDHLVNRIAAGEVVERPASVVKELVENALDAGASAVDVSVVGGGRRSIRVTDNGHGMDRDDCVLALERHATSKIGRGDPLADIKTLGFRGEALPSMAAVSRMVVRSATRHGEGTEVEIHGGKMLGVRDTGLARGTSVEVSNLFFNVPARRKFLRTESTELARIARVVTHYALAHPDVGFRLVHDDKVLLDASPARDRGERVVQIYGAEAAGSLLAFSGERGALRVEGFAGRPADAASSRERQHVFVNGRPVHDRVLVHAIGDAYGNTVPKGRRPIVLLFVTIPSTMVDVNVHPQKSEVRFARAAEVHDLARDAIVSVLSTEGAVPGLGDLRPDVLRSAPRETDAIAAAALRYLETHERPSTEAIAERPPGAFSARSSANAPARTGPREAPSRLESAGLGRAAAIPLAQYLDSYIIAEDAQGLLVVDQHVAHERVLYERYLAAAEADGVEVQRLLFPITIELTPEEASVFEQEAVEFRRLGFLAEPFGGTAVRFDGAPALAGDVDPVRLFRDLLGEAGQTRSIAATHDDLRRRLVTTAACRSAIKINHSLTMDGMQRLLDDLFRTANPTTCPHGRPVVFRLDREEIERAFRRR